VQKNNLRTKIGPRSQLNLPDKITSNMLYKKKLKKQIIRPNKERIRTIGLKRRIDVYCFGLYIVKYNEKEEY